MSLRASAGRPASCSGAMYCTVPAIAPCAVIGGALRRRRRRRSSATTARPTLARPKSSSFTPDFVIITLAGFRSRWTIPCAVRLVERVGDLRSRSAASARAAAAPRREPLRQRLAVEQFHHQIGARDWGLGTRRFADVVERADVRMRQLRDRPRFALEALARLGDEDDARRTES